MSLHTSSITGTDMSTSVETGSKSSRSSFIKPRGSIRSPPLTGIPSALRCSRYRKIDDEGNGEELVDQILNLRPILDKTGPLLECHTMAGSSVTLKLDRSICYRASPSSVAAWKHVSHEPPVEELDVLHADPFGDTPAVKWVPRILLAFSIDLAPALLCGSLPARETYEFACLDVGFFGLSTHGQGLLRKASCHSTTAEDVIVRGFLASDVAASGFLHAFGPTLYEGVISKEVILGEGSTYAAYKTFEARMASKSAPLRLDADSMAARGVDSGPGSQSFSSMEHSLPCPPDGSCVEPAQYGGPYIRLLFKRDTLQESAWLRRKFSFMVLLECCSDVPTIEARIKLETSTVRQNLSTLAAPPTAKLGKRTSWQKKRGSCNSPPSPSTGLGRQLSNTPSSRTDSSEAIVRILPRLDPISVISRGAGSVKDTLFDSGLEPKTSAGKSQAQGAGRLSAGPPISQRPGLGHSRTQSAQILPSMYRRSNTVSSWSSISEAEPGIGQQLSESPEHCLDGANRSAMMGQQPRPDSSEERSGPNDVFMSCPPVRSQCAYLRTFVGLDVFYLQGEARHKKEKQWRQSDSDTERDTCSLDDVNQLFETVLSDWTEKKMQEHTPPQSIVFVASPTVERRHIPFANAR